MKILIVEDDRSIVQNLSQFLTNEGFDVDSASGQRQALEKIGETMFDLVILDVSLSDGNGFTVCSAIKSSTEIPVIFLTASDDEFSTVAGLEMGADDYIAKPFRPRELVSRIKNVLRRNGKSRSVINLGALQVDTVKASVSKNGQDIYLSALEYRLLLTFLTNRGAILTRSQLLEEIWDIAGEFVNDNTLTVYIKRLRDKIEDDPQNPTIIKTVRGMGYKVGD